jgi:hypothetical protein
MVSTTNLGQIFQVFQYFYSETLDYRNFRFSSHCGFQSWLLTTSGPLRYSNSHPCERTLVDKPLIAIFKIRVLWDVMPYSWYISTKWHGTTSQMISVHTTVRTSDLIQLSSLFVDHYNIITTSTRHGKLTATLYILVTKAKQSLNFLQNSLLRANKSTIFWNTMLCSPLNVNWRFRGTYCLHLQGRSLPPAFTLVSFSAYSTLKMEAMFPWNVSWLSVDYTALYPRRQCSSYLLLWESQILQEPITLHIQINISIGLSSLWEIK